MIDDWVWGLLKCWNTNTDKINLRVAINERKLIYKTAII